MANDGYSNETEYPKGIVTADVNGGHEFFPAGMRVKIQSIRVSDALAGAVRYDLRSADSSQLYGLITSSGLTDEPAFGPFEAPNGLRIEELLGSGANFVTITYFNG